MDNNNLSIISLLEWYKKHKSHNRIHKLVFLGETTLKGKIYYRMLFCFDCKELLALDSVEIED